MRYAQTEADAGNLYQSRSVFERALAVDYTYVPLWHRYAETEAKARHYDNALNVLQRATSLLPMQSKLWLTRLQFAELRGDLVYSRQIFNEWAQTGSKDVWQPWYLFEKRYDRRSVPEVLKKWTRAIPGDIYPWRLLAAYGNKEEVYLSALESNALNAADTQWIEEQLRDNGFSEKPTGSGVLPPPEDPQGLSSREIHRLVEREAESSKNDLELWWATINRCKRGLLRIALLEAATKYCLPRRCAQKTMQWRMYALLWIRYATSVEDSAEDVHSVTAIYENAIACWDHAAFTSVSLWKNYAHYFLRKGDLQSCRKVLGSALGKTNRNFRGNYGIYLSYISLERDLLEDDRVRMLYRKLCSQWPQCSRSWVEFAGFELSLSERIRSNYLFQTALSLPVRMDDQDFVWKAWAEMVADHDLDRARSIWEKALLKCTDRADIFTNYAMFEVGTGLDEDSEVPDDDALDRARAVFDRGLCELQGDTLADLVEMYRQFEVVYGNEDTLKSFNAKTSPRVTEHKNDANQHVYINTGSGENSKIRDSNVGDSDSEHTESMPTPQPSALEKLLSNAHKWKESQSH